MTDTSIYKDISCRTGGDIYIGVVGPVRTGKSTFIRRFMETVVLPNIGNQNEAARARDEIPQSAAGKTVMTTEPKFVPDDAVGIRIAEGEMKVKMIDCVGYIVPGAQGLSEDGKQRMVQTPWSESPMPFDLAAETGTKKVITEHSTIAVLVTTDGSIGEIPRENYVEAEERVANELKKINKPFVIILNSAKPGDEASEKLAYELEEKYKAPVALVNCLELDDRDIMSILEMVLLEFPVKEVGIEAPSWLSALKNDNEIKKSVEKSISDFASGIIKIGGIKQKISVLAQNEFISNSEMSSLDLGKGRAVVKTVLPDSLFYGVMEEMTGLEIKNEEQLIQRMVELAEVRKQYERVEKALRDVDEKGYGIVTPAVEDLKLEEPEITKQQGSYGVKLKASAPSVHMIKATIKTELNPIVGTEQQSEELIKYMLNEFEEDPKKIWESNMFGKSLYELINEGLNTKLSRMPDEARLKLGDTLQKLINDGTGGLICIIL